VIWGFWGKVRKDEAFRDFYFLGFDESVQNTLVFFKPRTILYFHLKLKCNAVLNRYVALRRYWPLLTTVETL